jgi:hypothetical protein
MISPLPPVFLELNLSKYGPFAGRSTTGVTVRAKEKPPEGGFSE